MPHEPAVSRLRLPPRRCLVMGVVNVTPDSFQAQGRHPARAAAVAHALRLVEEGADIIDVGGESTRPGAVPVGEAEELGRVIPVIEALRAATGGPLSVDTSRPAVMAAAVRAGADLVNDVRALREDGALATAAGLGVPVVLMHMQGDPATMQRAPAYRDVVAEVREFLGARVAACEAAGIPRERLLVDPGFGFGKTLAQNLALLRGLPALAGLGCPVLVGLSRKSMVGQLLGDPGADRLHGSIALAVVAFLNGARIVRTHDVRATVEALRVTERATAADQGDGT